MSDLMDGDITVVGRVRMMIQDQAMQDYALCLIAFSALETALTDAVLALQRKDGDEAEFMQWARKPINQVADKLRALASEVATGDFFQAELHELSNACDDAVALKEWRNRHVHARARFWNGSVILQDKGGGPFSLDSEQFQQVMIRAIDTQLRIISVVDTLRKVLEFGDEFDADISKLDLAGEK